MRQCAWWAQWAQKSCRSRPGARRTRIGRSARRCVEVPAFRARRRDDVIGRARRSRGTSRAAADRRARPHPSTPHRATPRYEPHIPLAPAGDARQPATASARSKIFLECAAQAANREHGLRALKDLLRHRACDHQAGRIRTWEKGPFAERLPLFIDIPPIFNVRHNELTRSWERVIRCGQCGDFARFHGSVRRGPQANVQLAPK